MKKKKRVKKKEKTEREKGGKKATSQNKTNKLAGHLKQLPSILHAKINIARLVRHTEQIKR